MLFVGKSLRPLIALVLAALAFACERSNEDLLREASRLSNPPKPNYALAQRILEDVLERTAGDLSPSGIATRKTALTMRAVNFRAMGLLGAAESDFRSLLTQIDPRDTVALSFLSSILAERGNLTLDENQKNDLDYAVEFAERALEVNSEDWAVAAAVGLSRLSRGRYRRTLVTEDILVNSSGGDLDDLRAKITIATGLPAEDSRCIALTRELERRLELRSVDVRARVVGGVDDVRDDILTALASLRKALSLAPATFTTEVARALLDALYELEQQNEGIILSRIALQIPSFRDHPAIMETIAKTLHRAGLYEECALGVLQFVKESKSGASFETLRLAMRAAADAKNPDLIELLSQSLRKKLGKNADSSAFGRLLDFYDAYVLALRGGNNEEVAKRMASITATLDPSLADVIPLAALHGAFAARAIGSVHNIREHLDIGIATDPSNVDLLRLRAELELEGTADPLRAGKDVRNIIVLRPREVERYFPLLKAATEKFVAKTGRTLSTIEEESAAQGRKIPAGFGEGWIYYVLARDYYASERYAESANCALEAISRDADFKPAFVVLGLARAKLHDVKEARQAFERAIECIPDDVDVCNAVAQTGLAPPTISLYQLAARPNVEGRLVVADSMLDRGDVEAATQILSPLTIQADAPDSARILAARLLVRRSDPTFETLLSKVKPGGISEALANQVRLEDAVRRGDETAIQTLAKSLEPHLAVLQTDRLADCIRSARLRGGMKGVEPAARLLVAATPPARRREGLELLAQTLLESNALDSAVETLDRLLGLTLNPEVCVWLGLALDKRGDVSGVHEVLTMLRRDWGGSPFEPHRAILSVMAGVDPQPEEIASLRVGLDDPFSILAAASMFVVHTGRAPTSEELPRPSKWVDAAVEFVGTSRERAAMILRLALALRLPRGALQGLSELRNIDPATAGKGFSHYLQAEIFSAIPERRAEALPLFVRAAFALPDMDVAWARAVDMARENRMDAEGEAIVQAWIAARPNSPPAVRAARLMAAQARLRVPEEVARAEQDLTELAIEFPRDFEVALSLLEARTAARRVQDGVGTARVVLKLAEATPKFVPRATEAICNFFRSCVRDSLPEAQGIARSLMALAPEDWRPIELMVECDLAEGNFTDAADLALDFLRKPGRLKKLDDAEVLRFMSILLRTNPTEAGEIARLSVGTVPGDLARWRTFATTLESLNQDADALQFLRPFVQIEPSGSLRGLLAELLAKPGSDPSAALALVNENPQVRENPQGVVSVEHIAASRALALLGRADEAVKLLEQALHAADGTMLHLENRAAWLALAFALASRMEPGDALKAARILQRVSDGMEPGPQARFRSMGNLLLGLGRSLTMTRAAATSGSAPTERKTRPSEVPRSQWTIERADGRPHLGASVPSGGPESVPESQPASVPVTEDAASRGANGR